MTVSTETIAEWMEEEFNLEVYDYGDCVRITNGSAGHSVDIFPKDDHFKLLGQRYGEEIDTTSDPTRDALVETIRQTI